MRPLIGLITSDARRPALTSAANQVRLDVAPASFTPEKMSGVLIDGAADFRVSDESLLADLVSAGTEQDPFVAILAGPDLEGALPDGFPVVPSVRAFGQHLNVFARQKTIEVEAELRRQVLQLFQDTIPTGALRAASEPQTVVYFGDPSPFYLELKAELVRAGYCLNAVLSERTAFEALRSQSAAAFLIQISQSDVPHEILDHIQGRADLKSMPVIGLADMNEDIPDQLDGLTGIVRTGFRSPAAIKSITQLLSRQEQVRPITASLCRTPVRDASSGAFSLSFAERLIQSQASCSNAAGAPLCVGHIKVSNYQDGTPPETSELSFIANLLNAGIRQQDMLARYDWGSFLVSFPGTEKTQAVASLERMRRVLEMTPSPKRTEYTFSSSVVALPEYQSPLQFWNSIVRLAEAPVQRRQSNVA